MISIIVAITKDRAIGFKGGMPWRLSADLKRFASLTKKHTVIMGRKTHESILKALGKNLPDRNSVIITNQKDYSAPGCTVLHSINDLQKTLINNNEEVFIIGGGEMYKQFLPLAQKLYITEVGKDYVGDTFFPEFNKNDWKEIFREPHVADEKNDSPYTFIELVRK